MYLYNKNILEYTENSRSGPKFMIRDIEGLSNAFDFCLRDNAFLDFVKCEKEIHEILGHAPNPQDMKYMKDMIQTRREHIIL